jgi:hypothetical protein
MRRSSTSYGALHPSHSTFTIMLGPARCAEAVGCALGSCLGAPGPRGSASSVRGAMLATIERGSLARDAPDPF